jgi:hypothetical protein
VTQQRVFLSYAREDAGHADEIEAVLRRDGHSVWRDIGQIDGGDLWRERIVAALKESDVMVVLMSTRSTASGPVLRELTLASDYGLRVVPVLLEPVEVPATWEFQLAGIHIVDLPTVGIQEVREALGGPPTTEALEDGQPGVEPHVPPTGPPESTSVGSHDDDGSRATVGPTDIHTDFHTDAGTQDQDSTELLPVPGAPQPRVLRPERDGTERTGAISVPRSWLIAGAAVAAIILIVVLVAALGDSDSASTTPEPGPEAAGEPCTPVSQLPCDAVFVESVELRFDGDGGLSAGDGTGTGFTMVAPAASGAAYEPDALAVAGGRLQITAGPGTAFSAANNLANALAVGLQPESLEVGATIVDLPQFSGGNEHAGVWLFVDQNTYIKMNVVGAGDGTTILQALYERDGELIEEARVPNVPPGSVVSLALTLDADAGTVAAFGGFGPTESDAESALQRLSVFDADERFLGSTELDGRPVVFAGVFASRRNAAGPVTISFADFTAG